MYPDEETTKVWVALNRAQRSIYRTIDMALHAKGLPPLRWYDVLWELERARTGMRPFEVEDRLLFEQSNLSRLVQKLMVQGLVEEAPDPKDGRGKILSITKEGRALRKRMWTVYGPLIQKLLGEKLPEKAKPKISEMLNAVKVDHLSGS